MHDAGRKKAPVDRKHVTGDVASLLAREEERRGRSLLRRAVTVERDAGAIDRARLIAECIFATSSVSMAPGASAFTVTPKGASSTAITLVSAMTPPLAVP